MAETIPGIRRLNVNLPEGVHEELRVLAERSGRSMTDLVRTGLSLVTVAFAEAERSNTLAVADAEGRLIKQIVVPL
ncbi:MAG TPA: Arc family DNA-binding protein [Thermoanaerobaculia bacterium]|nr:Arc family DNA-binding protein [Thermoanaerobaculia bacterium]